MEQFYIARNQPMVYSEIIREIKLFISREKMEYLLNYLTSTILDYIYGKAMA